MTLPELISRMKSYLQPSPPSDTAIENAIVGTFADMCSRGDFYFMRAVDPTGPHSFTADDYEYDIQIDGCEKILALGVKATGEEVYTDIGYAEPDVFRRIKAGAISPGGVWWTIPAMVSANKFRIWFSPTPDANSGTFQIYYQMMADKNSITRMPSRWVQVLTDGVLASLDSRQFRPNHIANYEMRVAALPVRERIVTAYNQPYETNEYDALRNIENAELQ